jgi:hypothetical protein
MAEMFRLLLLVVEGVALSPLVHHLLMHLMLFQRLKRLALHADGVHQTFVTPSNDAWIERLNSRVRHAQMKRLFVLFAQSDLLNRVVKGTCVFPNSDAWIEKSTNPAHRAQVKRPLVAVAVQL